jgi:hypothetical protein
MRLRPLSLALFGLAVPVLGVAAVAAANSVSTRPPPAFVSSTRPELKSPPAALESRSDARPSPPSTARAANAGAAHDLGDDKGGSRSIGPSAALTPAAVTLTGAPTDAPATHDVGDDHGVHNPATHDVGDDHGGTQHR